MKKLIFIALIILVVCAAIVFFLLMQPGKMLRGPESITFDPKAKHFLVSNTLGRKIVSMNLDGKLSPFIKEGLNAPRGIMVWGSKLFIADENSLRIADPQTAKLTASIPITDAKMLNDVAVDRTGLVYLTDTAANCVFIVNPETKTVEKVNSPLLKAPNGIVYDRPRDQMFIVGFAKRSPILSLSTLDRSVTIFMDSIYSDLDGIAIDDLGRIYVSSWAQDMIFMIPQEQNRYIAQFKNISNAADMFYYLPNNELIVPLFNQNKIIRLALE